MNNTFKKVKEQKVIDPTPKNKAIIKLRDVNVKFGDYVNYTHAMKNVSFNVYQGEVLGLVGESGSGKSTTGNAIMGLIDRETGQVEIDGIKIDKKTKKMKSKFRNKFSQKVQMIFQDPTNSLNPQKTIKNIISEGLDNIDVKLIFSREFDTYTIIRLSRILKDKKQPEFVSSLNVEELLKEIEKGNRNLVYKYIYVDALKELRNFGTKYTREASTFLHLRKNERDHLLSGKTSKSKIKDFLINDILESVGLSKQILNRFPLEFSGGQQQRISISRSVVIKPEIIIADEPISALDVSIQAQVINIFNDLKEKMNLTILFIAHDLRMVEYISDRIAVMYKGRILEIGDASEIANNPIHPYTKALMASVPSINKINTILSEKKYDEKMHKYDNKNKPFWYQINDEEHYVLSSKEEIKKWMN